MFIKTKNFKQRNFYMKIEQVENVFLPTNTEKIFLFWIKFGFEKKKKDSNFKTNKISDQKQIFLNGASFFSIFVVLIIDVFLKKNIIGKNEMKIRLNFVISYVSLSFQKNWNFEILQNLNDLICYLKLISYGYKKFFLKENILTISNLFFIPFLTIIGTDLKSLQIKIFSLKANIYTFKNLYSNLFTKVFNYTIRIRFFLDFGKYLGSLFTGKNSCNILSKENLSELFIRNIVLTKTKHFKRVKTMIKEKEIKYVFLKSLPDEQNFNLSHFIYIKRKKPQNSLVLDNSSKKPF